TSTCTELISPAASKRTEPRANVFGEQLGLFHRREVSSPRHLRPALHIEKALRPFTRRPTDIRRKEGERRGDAGRSDPRLHAFFDPRNGVGRRIIMIRQE